MARKRTSTARAQLPASGDFGDVIEAFQSKMGLLVCVKLFDRRTSYDSDMEALAERYGLHQSPFCTEVKTTRNEACRVCDLRQLPIRCERERTLFVNTCHAGADEVIIPLVKNEILVGVAYVGQFRTRREQPDALPLLTPQQLGEVVPMARLLAAYLTEKLQAPAFAGKSAHRHRAEDIHAYLQSRLHTNPGLADLARYLGLSETRTTHVVKEVTGCSFVELKDTMRLERARSLLSSTCYKVAYVASHCGFSSTQYFHRFFKQKTGKTPNGFRLEYETEV